MRRRDFVLQATGTGLAALRVPTVLPTNAAGSTIVSRLEASPVDDGVELFELRVGRGLLHLLFSDGEASEVIDRIRRLRGKLDEECLRMPLIRIRDFAHLDRHEYHILISGHVFARGRVVAQDNLTPDDEAVDVQYHERRLIAQVSYDATQKSCRRQAFVYLRQRAS